MSTSKGLFIDPESGNVGIGTQYPSTEFQVKGNITPSACNVYNLGSSTLRFKDIYLSGNTIDVGGLQLSRGGDGGLVIKKENGQLNDATFANIYVNSNIGIGTTNPRATLDVLGNVNVFGNISTTNPRATLDVLGNVNVFGNIGNGTYIYDAYTKATNYSSLNGTHVSDANTPSWHTYLHFAENDARLGYIYNNSSDETLATEWVEYAVPSGMKQAWLAHLPWSSCRYFDIYGKDPAGNLQWLFRVNAYHNFTTVYNTYDHNGVTIIPICAVNRFTNIRISGVRGRYHILGFAWSKHDRQHNNGGQTGFIVRDNICGVGAVLQMVERRTEARVQYSCPPSGNGTLTDIYVDIVPTRSNSKILLQFMVNGEVHQDVVFLVHRSIGGEASVLIGYNTNRGNVRWSGIAASDYDQNEDSTPQTKYISWSDTPATLSSVRYYVAVRSSSSGTYTYAMNGVINGTNYINGADAYEITVSNAVATELWVA